MGNSKKRKKTSYDDSLPRIFLWSGFDVFVIMLITCTVLGFIIFFYRRLDSDGIKLILFCLAMVVPFSYGLPMISLIKVLRQELRLGVYWKDRNDYERPVWERDWYLVYDRGGFILCHRAYIKRILGTKVESEITSFINGVVYCVMFEDINGKKCILKFSSVSLEQNFRQWYKKRPDKEKEDEGV